ncbi:aquaporin [Pseudomonas sputi]|uniref:aquaporin n=1 Tax=Pseudomonas sputi TaxID=2892325 RepID=UPI001F2830EE|nr:aquaporin [Pseudomonas sputi]
MTSHSATDNGSCFFERNPNLELSRRAFVEGVGTLLLMLVITASGLTAQRLSVENELIILLVIGFATSAALVGLILAFGSVSGGHFNPLITALQWLAGDRKLNCTIAYIFAQFIGGVMGALVANQLFDSTLNTSATLTLKPTLVYSEILAATGLMIVVFGCSRGGLTLTGPFAVGAWLLSAIVSTPSTSYANPAIIVSALFAAGPVGLPLDIVLIYLPAEVVGALLAFSIISVAFPRSTQPDESTQSIRKP